MREKRKEERDWNAVFQWFHKHPELGFEEKMTTEKIKEILKEENIETLNLNLDTGVIAVIQGAKEGKSIAYRADIDGLPITEKTNLAYRSVNTGMMHACGHDLHSTIALAAAVRLNRLKSQLCGKIYFIFQPGEEVADGAKRIVQTGSLKEVTEYYALHADPDLPVGTFGIKEGAVMAAVDKFQVIVKGKGVHAATPYLGNSPIPPMIQMVSALQNMIPNKISALHPGVLTVTQINAGNTWNVIPEEGYFQGTVRSMNAEDRKWIRNKFAKTVQAISDAYEVEVDIQWYAGPSTVVNSRELVDRMEFVCEKSGAKSERIESAMISDDFSIYLEDNHAKGIYIRAGVGKGHPLHHPEFQVDREAIHRSIELVENMLITALEK